MSLIYRFEISKTIKEWLLDLVHIVFNFKHHPRQPSLCWLSHCCLQMPFSFCQLDDINVCNLWLINTHFPTSGYSARFQKPVVAVGRNSVSKQPMVRAARLGSSKSLNIKQENSYHTLFEGDFQSNKVRSPWNPSSASSVSKMEKVM